MVTARALQSMAEAADLLALTEEVRAEIINGQIVEKAAPSFEHSSAQLTLGGWAQFVANRSTGGPPAGGWWFASEVDIQLEPHQVLRPDVVGWRRERVPERPRGRPVTLRPDWICEVLSPSNARVDTTVKLAIYHRCGVPHYWLVDPERETLMVQRWHEAGYLVVLAAARGEVVRPEPFEAAELKVGILFGEDPDPIPPATPG